MQKIKFDPITTFLLILVIILIFHAFFQYLKKVSCKEEELKGEIERCLFKMNLAQEKRKELKERAAQRFKVLSVSFFVAFGILITALTWFGVSYIDALEGVTGTIAVTFFMYTWIAYGKIGVNQFLDMLKAKVLQHVYKKNGFNPKVIDELQMSIDDKIAQLEKLDRHEPSFELTVN